MLKHRKPKCFTINSLYFIDSLNLNKTVKTCFYPNLKYRSNLFFFIEPIFSAVYKLNYRQLNAVSTLTASRFQNSFCVMPTLAVTNCSTTLLLSHLTAPPHPQPLILNSPIRTTGGCHTDTHKAGEQLYSAASAIFGRVFIWRSSATVTPN